MSDPAPSPPGVIDRFVGLLGIVVGSLIALLGGGCVLWSVATVNLSIVIVSAGTLGIGVWAIREGRKYMRGELRVLPKRR